jgi:hypothetical protein
MSDDMKQMMIMMMKQMENQNQLISSLNKKVTKLEIEKT